eukprot:tig00000955_g5796.t1
MKEGQPSSIKWETFAGNRFLDIPAGTTEMTVSLDWDKRDTLFIEERRTNIAAPMHQAPGGIPAYGAALYSANSAPPAVPVITQHDYSYDNSTFDPPAADASSARPRSLNSLQPVIPGFSQPSQPQPQPQAAPIPVAPMQLPYTGRLGVPRRVRSYSAFGNRYPLSLDPIIEEPNAHPPPQEDVYNYPVRPKRRAPSPQLRYSVDPASGFGTHGYTCSASAESSSARVRVSSPGRSWSGNPDDEPMSAGARNQNGVFSRVDSDESNDPAAVQTLAQRPHRGGPTCSEHGQECPRGCARRGAGSPPQEEAEQEREQALRPPPPAPARVFSGSSERSCARDLGCAASSLA